MLFQSFSQTLANSGNVFNDFSCPFSGYIQQIQLTASTPASFVVPNLTSMNISSAGNKRYVVIFKPQYGKNIFVDPTGNPTLPTGTFASSTTELITPNMGRYVQGGTTLYFETTDVGGAFVQAVIYPAGGM
jgi:hypothetical protein